MLMAAGSSQPGTAATTTSSAVSPALGGPGDTVTRQKAEPQLTAPCPLPRGGLGDPQGPSGPALRRTALSPELASPVGTLPSGRCRGDTWQPGGGSHWVSPTPRPPHPPRIPPGPPRISSPSPSCRSPSWRADPAWGQPWGPGLSPPKKIHPAPPRCRGSPSPLVPPAPGCSVPRSASAHPRGGPRCPCPHCRPLTQRDTERGLAPRPPPPTFWGCCPLRRWGTRVTPSPVNGCGGCHRDEGSRWVPAGGGDVPVR